jgi:PilZ domain-containing protein
MTNNQRRHHRLKHRAKIRLKAPPSEPVIVNMRDFSESGLFLFCENSSLVKVGDIVEVKTMEFEDAPIQEAKVVRIEKNTGFAVEFINI